MYALHIFELVAALPLLILHAHFPSTHRKKFANLCWHNIFSILSKNAMNRNEEQNNNERIPENSSTKPMDSKRDVEASPDEKTDQDFPGYPHYPAKEDIMNQNSGFHRVDANLEEMGTGPNASGVNQRFLAGQDQHRDQEAVVPRAEGESDDLAAINSRDSETGLPQNVTNEDLAADKPLPGSSTPAE